MDWNNLKVALAIGQTGSLTRAAQVLGVDTSTAGRRLSALEADLGVMLFVRTKAGFAMTDAGAVAIKRAVDVQNRIEQLIDEVTEPADGPIGTIRLASNTWIVDRLAQTAVPSFLETHPMIDLCTTVRPADSLAQGGVSLSLWFETEPKDGAFKISLGKVPYAIYRSRKAEGGKPGWVAFHDEKMTTPLIERANRRLKKRDEPLRFTSTDAGVLLSAVSAGLGKGLLPMCLAEDDERVVRVSAGEPVLERVLYVHAYHDTVQTRRVQAAIKWLRESFDAVFQPRFTETV
ncbi:LysR family transcriptional regulator [Pelagibius sp. Alg239-R121]|uniref:LysR family transcriptional regulator n=1 Tax=Pelagibius sp. Alg239-R121 TaxID=2993448 RepID=UPI0024A6476C|nr:LysR family transcriptional regulator [Pelagibius sp. Alg239-R121]